MFALDPVWWGCVCVFIYVRGWGGGCVCADRQGLVIGARKRRRGAERAWILLGRAHIHVYVCSDMAPSILHIYNI